MGKSDHTVSLRKPPETGTPADVRRTSHKLLESLLTFSRIARIMRWGLAQTVEMIASFCSSGTTTLLFAVATSTTSSFETPSFELKTATWLLFGFQRNSLRTAFGAALHNSRELPPLASSTN